MPRIVILAERLPGDSLARPFLEMVFLTSPHLESKPRGMRSGRHEICSDPHRIGRAIKADAPFGMTIA
jgi:hypothetical protein